MTTMTEVLGASWPFDLVTLIDEGYVTSRHHPEFDNLRILNYTAKCAYEGKWNKLTLTMRGLIYDYDTDEILARPFAKFFNYGQAEAPTIDLDAELFHVGDKFDGSLGIGYIRPDGVFAIATRGSFDSEQARHANQLLRQDTDTYSWYHGDVSAGHTPLFEIIYPDNRIVLDYGDRDYLQHLGWVDIFDGSYLPPGTQETEPGTTFASVLAREPRQNAEGWVIWIDGWHAVKIKQDDYVALHKIVTGLSEKVIWTWLQEGPNALREHIAELPDELQPWAENVALSLSLDFSHILSEIDDWYMYILDITYRDGDDAVPRRVFAEAVMREVPAHYRGFMFSTLDGKAYTGKVWAMIEPRGVGSRPGNLPVDEDG